VDDPSAATTGRSVLSFQHAPMVLQAHERRGSSQSRWSIQSPGVEALYLSRSVETASAEYQQDEPLMPPGTLVTYRIALSRVVDLQKGYVRGEWDEL